MRVLFVGGTGQISAASSRAAVARGWDVTVLNRGEHATNLPGARHVIADVRDVQAAGRALDDQAWDAVVDWVAFEPADIERDLELFRGRTGHYVFVSSASVYLKPPEHYLISERTPLGNPYWEYARGKIACEARVTQAHCEEGFPATIVRPSMTYDTNLPIALGGWGTYTLVDRLLSGRGVIVHGDGTSLWVVTHADDLAHGLLGLLGNERAIGETFQITSDEVLTWNEIYMTIAEAVGVEPRIVHIPTDFIVQVAPDLAGTLLGDKTWSVVFDDSKIREFVPGFEAAVPLRQGIRRTFAWFHDDPGRRVVDESVNASMDTILAAYKGGRSE